MSRSPEQMLKSSLKLSWDNKSSRKLGLRRKVRQKLSNPRLKHPVKKLRNRETISRWISARLNRLEDSGSHFFGLPVPSTAMQPQSQRGRGAPRASLEGAASKGSPRRHAYCPEQC